GRVSAAVWLILRRGWDMAAAYLSPSMLYLNRKVEVSSLGDARDVAIAGLILACEIVVTGLTDCRGVVSAVLILIGGVVAAALINRCIVDVAILSLASGIVISALIHNGGGLGTDPQLPKIVAVAGLDSSIDI